MAASKAQNQSKAEARVRKLIVNASGNVEQAWGQVMVGKRQVGYLEAKVWIRELARAK